MVGSFRALGVASLAHAPRLKGSHRQHEGAAILRTVVPALGEPAGPGEVCCGMWQGRLGVTSEGEGECAA